MVGTDVLVLPLLGYLEAKTTKGHSLSVVFVSLRLL